MDPYEQFYDSINKAIARFKSWDKKQPIKIISHLDADGISASAIITNLLNHENRKYSTSILPQLDREELEKLSKEEYKYIIFTDFGSGHINDIKELLKEKEIIILDHHEPERVEPTDNITHINPHLNGIDGSKEISGAGVVYLFTSSINKKHEDMSHLAIIGAIGDVQEENGFLKLNKLILEKAIKNNKIKTKQGLRFFGRQTRPIHKVLEYSTDPYIPDVSGSESGAIQFLNQIKIDPKKGTRWKTIAGLNNEEREKLVTGIIMKRLGEINPEDVLGNIYSLPHEKKGSPTRDAREFATLLNACGRMGNASAGIGLCLGIKKDRQRAMKTLAGYKKEIVNALNWYDQNKNTKNIIKGENYTIINAQDNVLATIIGTMASIISKSNNEKDQYVMSLARTNKKTTKISLRISKENKNIDLREIVKNIVEKTGGEAGGHIYAAGGQIPVEKETEFIQEAKNILEKEVKKL